MHDALERLCVGHEDLRLLPFGHRGDIGLVYVALDPDDITRDHEHGDIRRGQSDGASLHVLALLDIDAGDDAVDRRGDDGIPCLVGGLLKGCLGAAQLRLQLGHLQRLFADGDAVGLCTAKPGIGLFDGGFRRRQVLRAGAALCQLEVGSGRLQAGGGCVATGRRRGDQGRGLGFGKQGTRLSGHYPASGGIDRRGRRGSPTGPGMLRPTRPRRIHGPLPSCAVVGPLATG